MTAAPRNRWPTRAVSGPLAAVAVLLATMLAGCASPGALPEDHFYMLPDPHAATVLHTPLLEGTLAVTRLRAAGVRNERAMLYIEEAHPLQILRYHYHYWSEPPTELIRNHLVAYLRKLGVATQSVTYMPGMEADAVVRGELLRFERELGATGTGVHVEIELSYMPKGRTAPLWSKAYRAQTQARNASIDATVAAFSIALQQIYAEFVRDLQVRLPAAAPTPLGRR